MSSTPSERAMKAARMTVRDAVCNTADALLSLHQIPASVANALKLPVIDPNYDATEFAGPIDRHFPHYDAAVEALEMIEEWLAAIEYPTESQKMALEVVRKPITSIKEAAQNAK